MIRSARAYVARALCLLMLAALAAAPARAPDTSAPAYKITYTIPMADPASPLFYVRVDVAGVAGAGHVDFQMPRWSPGRYAVFDFAKNVQQARASGMCMPDERCGTRGYPVERLDTQTWRVGGLTGNEIEFNYQVFADDLSGTFSQLDTRHGTFNGHSVFAYVVGHKHDPVTLKVNAPGGWKVINGQSKSTDQYEFRFANYDLMADTPTEVAPDFNVESLEVGGRTYRVVVHSFGDEGGKREAKLVL